MNEDLRNAVLTGFCLGLGIVVLGGVYVKLLWRYVVHPNRLFFVLNAIFILILMVGLLKAHGYFAERLVIKNPKIDSLGMMIAIGMAWVGLITVIIKVHRARKSDSR